MILVASKILKIIGQLLLLVIVHTKLWVDVYKGEDEGEFLIFLLSEESYEANNVVEQEWSQHRGSHLVVSSPVQFVDEIDVSDNISSRQYDVKSHDDQD